MSSVMYVRNCKQDRQKLESFRIDFYLFPHFGSVELTQNHLLTTPASPAHRSASTISHVAPVDLSRRPPGVHDLNYLAIFHWPTSNNNYRRRSEQKLTLSKNNVLSDKSSMRQFLFFSLQSSPAHIKNGG